MINLTVNGVARAMDVEEDAPLLWLLRDELGLTGTKYGCGVGACGACTVLIDGKPARSCVVSAARANGTAVQTIEGLSSTRDHPLQRAWIARQVPQCGYCQSGMIMAAAALLRRNPAPTEADVRSSITNLCRCGTYPRIIAAILDAAAVGAKSGGHM